MAVARHLPPGRHRAGDRHLNFYDSRDNLVRPFGRVLSCARVDADRAICTPPRGHFNNEAGDSRNVITKLPGLKLDSVGDMTATVGLQHLDGESHGCDALFYR